MSGGRACGGLLGLAAEHDLNADLKVLLQAEGYIDLSAAPSVRDGFGARNSYLGFASKTWGALKGGKNDTPYKTSTSVFDPFANTIGDYNSIMGNTGGDGRAEFDQRANHAIWYESPNIGPFQFNFMWSRPGRTRPATAATSRSATIPALARHSAAMAAAIPASRTPLAGPPGPAGW